MTCGVSFEASLALDLPNCMTLLPPPCMDESRNQKMTPMIRNGSRMLSSDMNQLVCVTVSSKFSRFASLTASTTSEPRGVA